MAIWIKVDGTWQQAAQAWVKIGGVYRQVTNAYHKGTDHTYHQAFLYDKTPPDPPQVSLEIIDALTAGGKIDYRYIKVGARLNGASNDNTARLIRVLTNYAGKAPTGHEGGTYTSTPDKDWPKEPWSEWRYNQYGQHTDSSVYNYKQWPVNASANTEPIANDHQFFFTAWALDNNGNWSAPTSASITTPKAGVLASNVIVREANFQPNSSGSWRSAGFQSGDLVQMGNPRSVGLFFYGNQLTDAIGSHGAPTIRSAQIWLKRPADDGGSQAADLYLFSNGYAAPGDLPAAGASITKNTPTKITPPMLSKGMDGWYPLPDAIKGAIEHDTVKALGLDYKDPVKAGYFPTDQSTISGVGDDLKNGQLHITWAEKV